MKINLHTTITLNTVLLSSLLLLVYGSLSASNSLNQVIVTGQVANSESGIPLNNHKVFIVNDESVVHSEPYFNSVYTDIEGFYVDTIPVNQNAGSFIIYTYDLYGNKSENTVHYRLLKTNPSNFFVVDFSVDYPLSDGKLQARFRYFNNDENNRLSYKFVNQNSLQTVNSWQWDFGDGSSSREKNPVHVYENPGFYKVTLTVKSGIEREHKLSVISKLLFISNIDYHHIGGHCFAGYFPVDEGKAFLYKVENENTLIPIDTATIDTLGYYYFYQVPEGDYYVKSQPDKRSSAYGNMIPTYYGDEPYWQKAEVILNDHTNWEYDIHLIEGKSASPGTGKVSGKVTVTGAPRDMESSFGKDVDIYLFDGNDELVMSHYTDENHAFSFESLAMGVYYIAAEIAGLPSEKIKVNLSDGKPVVKNIEIQVSHPELNMFAREIETVEFNSVGYPYPNPSVSQISIDIRSTSSLPALIEVLDLGGNIMFKSNCVLNNGINKSTIQTSSMTKGIYLLRIVMNDEVIQRRFIVNK
jgi:hypothetical protein